VAVDTPFLAGDLEHMTEQDQIPLCGGRRDLAQPFIAKAGHVHSANASNKASGEGMSHQGRYSLLLRRH
jgi:hypothetical protein